MRRLITLISLKISTPTFFKSFLPSALTSDNELEIERPVQQNSNCLHQVGVRKLLYTTVMLSDMEAAIY